MTKIIPFAYWKHQELSTVPQGQTWVPNIATILQRVAAVAVAA
jgi:hypothetical protein